MISAFFKQPKTLPEGWYFPKPEIFTGEYGKIFELMWCGLIVGLCIAVIIVLFRHR